MPIFTLILGVLLLLFLVVKKINPFIALLVVSIVVGIISGMPLTQIIVSIKDGIGSTLGSIALVIVLGVMFGKVIEESGAARRITLTLIEQFGKKHIQWAVVITGFIVGLPMFYNAGFILLLPLIFSVAAETGLSLIYVGLPMAAALSVTHGFLPPHPGPTALAGIFKANIGLTLIYGLIISIPAIFLAGPVFTKFLKKINASPPKGLFDDKLIADADLPSGIQSISIALLPIVLIAFSAFLNFVLPNNSNASHINIFLGEPFVALIIALLFSVYFLQLKNGKNLKDVMDSMGNSVSSVALIMLIIASGGAFKQVLIDGGIGDYICHVSKNFPLSPLILGWAIAALLRVSIGSATVAGLTAAGIVAPMLSGTSTSPELMVLSVGAGSLMFSHVNDTGFWMFKEFFNLSVKQTFLSWSIMETIISVVGLLGVLTLNAFFGTSR